MARQISIMTSQIEHRYDRFLYEPLEGRIGRVGLPSGYRENEDAVAAALDWIDIFHLHWPELLLGPDQRQHALLIETLERQGVPIVWTQHNLLPHVPHRAWGPIYQRWAAAASGVIHHSHWGMRRVLEQRSYHPGAVHRVIRHGHWGAMRVNAEQLDRDELAKPYKLAPERIHLGILGSPRASKDLQLVVDAFLACDRDDLDLAIFSLEPDQQLPKHPRLVGRRYSFVDREIYNRRLAFIDVLILPFRPDGQMLTTGQIGDAIGVGKPAIISDWPFLTESFGEAAIVYGHDVDGLRRCLETLDPATLDDRSDAMRALQPHYEWSGIAEATLDLFETVLAQHKLDPAAIPAAPE